MHGNGLKKLSTEEAGFARALETLLVRQNGLDVELERSVKAILSAVRAEGDAAVLRFTEQYDELPVATVKDLFLEPEQLQTAVHEIGREQRQALEQAADRIRVFHERQLQSSWTFEDDDGNLLGQRITPLDRVGLYVPGGKAAYPSSVLMNAVVAKVAQVAEIIMVVPSPKGVLNPMVLAAAYIAGVDKVIRVGGAQAVAALAYGTETISKVDKIVGPGNQYVAMAKRLVFGQVGIDMIAGPSEILIVADASANPDWIAMDLFSQAEHDECAQSILIALDKDLMNQVEQSIAKLLPTQPRRAIIEQSLSRQGALIYAHSREQALALVNQIAPEHLALAVEGAQDWLPDIRHAGAIFIGYDCAEVLGDYCLGPNHVLPTAGSARFSSPLGVYDFQKRSSIMQCSAIGASKAAAVATVLAESESLYAHKQAADYRLQRSKHD